MPRIDLDQQLEYDALVECGISVEEDYLDQNRPVDVCQLCYKVSGFTSSVAHPSYGENDYHCAICGRLLSEDDDEDQTAVSVKAWINNKETNWNESVNKYNGPSMASPIVGELYATGELVQYIQCLAEGNGGYFWYQFQSKEGDSFWVRDDIVDIAKLKADSVEVSPLTYHSQNDANSSLSPNDCGPACSTMLLSHAGITTTVNKFMQDAGINHRRYTLFDENIAGLRCYGHDAEVREGTHLSHALRYLATERHPIMSLINITPLRPTRIYSHFILLSGYRLNGWDLQVQIQDPNAQTGENEEFPASSVADAMGFRRGQQGNDPWQSLFVTTFDKV